MENNSLFSSYNKPRICSKDYKTLHVEFCLIFFSNSVAICSQLCIQRNGFHGELSKMSLWRRAHRGASVLKPVYGRGEGHSTRCENIPATTPGTSLMPSCCGPSREGEMGCTPSKLAVVYGEDTVCQDLDTCSTFVSSLKSTVSTPETTRRRVDAGGNTTLLGGEFTARPKIQMFDHRILRLEICHNFSD